MVKYEVETIFDLSLSQIGYLTPASKVAGNVAYRGVPARSLPKNCKPPGVLIAVALP